MKASEAVGRNPGACDAGDGPVDSGHRVRRSHRLLHPVPREDRRAAWPGHEAPMMALMLVGASRGRRSDPEDRPDLRRRLAAPDRPDHQLLHRLRPALLARLPAGARRCSRVRREQIAQGLANAAKIKAALAENRSAAAGGAGAGPARRAKLIAEAQAAAGRCRNRKRRQATAAAEQIVTQAQEAAEQDRTRACSPTSGAKSAGWSCRRPPRSSGKMLTPDDQRRLAEETARQLHGN